MLTFNIHAYSSHLYTKCLLLKFFSFLRPAPPAMPRFPSLVFLDRIHHSYLFFGNFNNYVYSTGSKNISTRIIYYKITILSLKPLAERLIGRPQTQHEPNLSSIFLWSWNYFHFDVGAVVLVAKLQVLAAFLIFGDE